MVLPEMGPPRVMGPLRGMGQPRGMGPPGAGLPRRSLLPLHGYSGLEGEMSQYLRALAVLCRGPTKIPSTYMVVHSYL